MQRLHFLLTGICLRAKQHFVTIERSKGDRRGLLAKTFLELGNGAARPKGIQMSQSTRGVMVESLEGRRLFSTVHPALLLDDGLGNGDLFPVTTVASAVLTKDEVIGNYKGSAMTAEGKSLPLKLLVRAASLSLTVTGYGSAKIALSAHQLNKLRDGTFAYTATVSGETVSLAGTINSAGTRISGTFTGKGPINTSGTFVLKKY